jgi:homoserine dehydrogenase
VRGRIGVGLLGFGTIGTGVVKIFEGSSALLRDRLGIPLELVKVADVDLDTPRAVKVNPDILTTDAREVIHHPEVDVVVELIGGIEPAKSFILEALKVGKPVVTANKALLAEHGEEILRVLKKKGLDLGFEASVAGGVPILKALREGLVANNVVGMYGIINGTANYVLTMMEEKRFSFEEALADAQTKGYAEADPTLDISGMDAAHKTAILATMAFGRYFRAGEVYVEGISRVSSKDIVYAQELGYRIKLLAIVKSGEEIEIRVHPTMIPLEHSLANVDGVFNAIYVEGDAVGPTMFYGRGAGEMPTASAVVADVVDIARNILRDASRRVPPFSYDVLNRDVRVKPMADVVTRYYMRFTAQDRPGVLSGISGILASRQISIESVIQKGRREDGAVPVVMMTHEAREKDVKAALREIDSLDVIVRPTMLIRVEDGQGW